MASSNSTFCSSALAAALALATACGRAPDITASIPPGATLIAGIGIAELRASPLYPKLPPKTREYVEQFPGVSFALVSYDGRELLVAARGDFQSTPPAGTVILTPGIALFGSPRQVEAARTQYKTGESGAPELVAQADAVKSGKQVWVAARGDAPLPFGGNAANLLRILRNADLVTLTASLGPQVAVELRASARNENTARVVEETLRADLTLAALAAGHEKSLATTLSSGRVTRTGRDVKVDVGMSDADAARVMSLLAGSGPGH